MADEPELKSSTRQKVMNPLVLAWAFVIILMGLTALWVTLSEDPADINPAQDTEIAASTEGDIIEPGEEDTNNNNDTPAEVTTPINQPEQASIAEALAPLPPAPPVQFTLASSQSALSPAPNRNLLIEGENGFKPAMGPDGLIAWKEYARPYSGPEETPRIAIMVTDIGLNTKSSTAAIDNLPGQIDLGFSPYGRNLQGWMDKARAKGHEGFLMLPTEPLNYPQSDPGPHTLLTYLSKRENLLRLDWILSQVTGYVGVVNHMGSKFTASEQAITPIIEELRSRGLMFVDARSSRFSMAARIARRLSMPRALNDRYIDNEMTAEDINRQLGELERTATTFGAALGMARAVPLSINEIAKWSLTLKEKGIELVPVSAIANRQPIK